MATSDTEGAGIDLRRGRLSDVPLLSRSLTDDFEGSRLVHLGPRFIDLLNAHIVTSKHCVCLVAERRGEYLGAGVAVTSTRRFYREFVARKGLHCAMAVVPRLLHPVNLRTLLKGFTYFPSAPAGDPEAEIISFVVGAHATRSGVGTILFQGMVEALRAQGINRIKIVTSTGNEASNAFYARQGCRRLRSEGFYQDTRVNVYVYDSL